MNGGKDIKFGDDKRPVSIVPSNEQELFNINNGEKLTDEFGNPLITEVDTFYLPDISSDRSTSVVLPSKESAFQRNLVKGVGSATVEYADLDTHVNPHIATVNASTLQISGLHNVIGTVLQRGGSTVTLEQYPHFEVRVIEDLNIQKNELYGNIPATVKVGDAISGRFITSGSFVSEIAYNRSRIYISQNYDHVNVTAANAQTTEPNYVGLVTFFTSTKQTNKHDPTITIEEQFRETSEVSTTLLGVNRAETQLSLFSNVSSYGLDPDEFETFSWSGGNSFTSWDRRFSKLYGQNRYNAKETEETQESAIRIASFAVPYSYPFGPKFEKLGIYEPDNFGKYIDFIQLGNDLHEHFKNNSSYPTDWKNKFLPINTTTVVAGDVNYTAGIDESFAQIDTWTDTWRDIKDGQLTDPVTNEKFNFTSVSALSEAINAKNYDATNTRPGYADNRRHYAYMQSRRVFRYQPGRISGFTFGLRSSTEPVTGATMEWGISNPTDQYTFRVFEGQLSIVRRSQIPLESSSLARSGLTLTDQTRIVGNDPFDTDPTTGEQRLYWTTIIPRDKFNGDPLNGNGPSGYLIKPEKVTMWKIEFGWYGAIGARFYVYIPADNGDARWVVVHTLVIENSLRQPCLVDSYFRFKYELNVTNTGDLRQPQFLYKYGASYYIDGGDEGTLQTFSASSGVKQIFGGSAFRETLLGIRPKDFITNSTGEKIINKKIVIPDTLSVTTDSLSEIKVETCKACPGFGHVHTPGVRKTDLNRQVNITFDDPSTMSTTGSDFFFKTDEGAKLIAPSIRNAYIDKVSGETSVGSGNFTTATIKGYIGVSGVTFGARNIADGSLVFDSITNSETTIGLGDYPHPVRLSQKNFYVASNFKLTGTKIEIQFINPRNSDDFGHFADFDIGITNVPPVTPVVGDALNGFSILGVTTSVLPDNKMLFGNYSHRYAALSEDGVENVEIDDRLQPPNKLGIDFKIPSVPNPAGGMCSKVTFDVQDELELTDIVLISGDEPNNRSGSGFYLEAPYLLPTNIEYEGGQVAIRDENGNPDSTAAKFVGAVKEYVSGDQQYSYIEIDGSITPPSSPFVLLLRPIKMSTVDGQTKTKLYNFNPYPLFFVAKMSDKSAINNLSIKETSGTFQKTTSPKLFVSRTADNTTDLTWSGSGEVTLADNNTSNTASPPTNFKGGDRLSGSEIDNQNIQNIRPGVLRDTFYVGKKDEQITEEIDMTKVFGVDRRVIAPDQNNIEATFLTARKIDPGATGEIEVSLNYKEQ